MIKFLIEHEIPDYEFFSYGDPREIIKEEISKLSLINQEILRLRDYEGLSYKEISEITGTKIKTLKMRHYKCLLTLKGKLEKRLPSLKQKRDSEESHKSS